MKVTNGSVDIVQPIFGETEKSDFCDSEQVGENDSTKNQIDDSTKSIDQVGENNSSKTQFDNQVVDKESSKTQFVNQVGYKESSTTQKDYQVLEDESSKSQRSSQKFDQTKHDDDFAYFTTADKKTSRFPPEGFVWVFDGVFDFVLFLKRHYFY